MKIDAKQLNEAISELENVRRIPKEEVIASLKDAMENAYRRQLSGSFNDALVRAEIDVENGIINLYQIKIIKEDVTDDMLEYPLEDAVKENPDYKEGDEYLIPCDINSLKNAFVMAVRGRVKQGLAEKEKAVLMEEFKDKLHTMITGKVESVDEKGASVNIGRATVYLTRRQMIGDENFALGDPIKLYVADISTGKAGAQIIVSRSNEGFLRKLFEEEIHDVYSHVIEIKNIARDAGSRSKVAVYCDDPSIDPAGSCIGPSGTRIQKIVNQLGNGSNKEKIDIITYSEIPGLYILEALKPARVVGVKVNNENKTAIAVVKDDSISLAYGLKGVNIRLASRLTGYKIEIKSESEAIAEGLEFASLEQLQLENSELIRARAEEKKKMAKEERKTNVLPGLPEDYVYVAPQERKYEDERSDVDEALEEQSEEEVPAQEEIKKQPLEETPIVSASESENKPSKVNTTTTLEALERSLEEDTSKEKKFTKKKKTTKVEEKKEEETSSISKVSPEQRMAIYTEEEKKAIEEEEALENEDSYEDEDVDYDEYDEYYDN